MQKTVPIPIKLQPKRPQNAPAANTTSEKRVARRARKKMKVKMYRSMDIGSQPNQVQQLAMCIASPAECAVRPPTVDMPRTAIMQVRDVVNIVGNVILPPNGFIAGDLLIAFYGQPGRQMVAYHNYTNGGIYNAVFGDTRTGSITGSTWQAFSGSTVSTTGTAVASSYWPLASMNHSSGIPAYGSQMCIGFSNGVPFVWLNNGDLLTISVSIGGSTPTASFVWSLVAWQDVGEAPVQATNMAMTVTSAATGVSPITAPSAGYFALKLEEVNVTVGTLTLANVTLTHTVMSNNGWVHYQCGDLVTAIGGDPTIGEEIRAVGSSFLATNVTSLLNRQGVINAARMRISPFFNITPTNLLRAAEKFEGDAVKGVYTFAEFSSARQFFHNSYTKAGPCFQLEIDDYFHFIQISNPAWNTQPNSYLITLDNVLEFKTDTARYAKGISPLDYTALIAAVRLVNSRSEWFYENPQYMKQIYNLLRKAGAGIRDSHQVWGPAALHAYGLYNPAALPVTSALSQYLGYK